MRHELLIEKNLDQGDWVRLDLGDEVPVMVFQTNDLNDLKDRQTSFSQALKLPITPSNCRAFDFANEFAARSSAPYRIHRCAWYVDGAQVVGPSFRLEVRSVDNDSFNCQIVTNVYGLFERLSNKTFEELDIPPILWNAETIAASINANDTSALYTWMFPITTQIAGGDYGRLWNGDGEYLAAEVLPYFRFLPLVKEILRQEGYTLDTDVDDAEMCLSMSNPRFTTNAGVPVRGSIHSLTTLSSSSWLPLSLFGPGLPQVSFTFDYNAARVLTGVRDPDFPDDQSLQTAGVEYCAPGYMNCRLMFDTQSYASADDVGRVRYRVRRIGGYTDTYLVGQEVIVDEVGVSVGSAANPGGGRYTSDVIEMSPGDRIFIEAQLLSFPNAGSAYSTYQSTCSILLQENDNDTMPTGGVIYPNLSTDFKDQLEAIMLFVRVYCLLVDVDVDSRVVRMHGLSNVISRALTGDYADWSGKLDARRSRTTNFRLGAYQQDNRILMSKNELLGVQRHGSIIVDDENLQATKDLFTLATETTVNGEIVASGGSRHLADIDVRYIAESREFFKFKLWDNAEAGSSIRAVVSRAPKTHLVRCKPMEPQGSGTLRIMTTPPPNNSGSVVQLSSCMIPVAVDPQEIVDENYAVMKGVLNPARVVEAMFNLDAIDIANLDLLRPVYVAAYGDLFYIQKISNYQPHALTRVTLVSLNVAGKNS